MIHVMAEVNATLTKSSSGHRRKGGGRFGFLPHRHQDGPALSWVRRRLLEETERQQQHPQQSVDQSTQEKEGGET